MTKFLCIDFDSTLTDPQVSYLIKKIFEFKSTRGLKDLKIGIITSRSIYDDFKTFGQFYHDIVDVLVKNDIELDFICTRFCLHVINLEDYAEHGISSAITRANKVPVFGEKPSDYLLYRAKYRKRIEKLKQMPTPKEVAALKKLVKDDIKFELGLRSTYIDDHMMGVNTPKVNQIETTIARFYEEPPAKIQVLLLDDAYKHVLAIDSYPDDNWEGCLYTGDIKSAESSIRKFLEKKHTPKAGSTFKKAFSESLMRLRHKGIFRSLSSIDEDSGSSKNSESCIDPPTLPT